MSVALRLIELRYRPSGRRLGDRRQRSFLRTVTTDASATSCSCAAACARRRSTSRAGSNREKNARCSEWQLTHPPSDAFCACVPGALMISSALVICSAILIGRVIFVSGRSSRVRFALQIDRGRGQLVADGADAHRVVARFHPVAREAVLTLRVADDPGADRRAVALRRR